MYTSFISPIWLSDSTWYSDCLLTGNSSSTGDLQTDRHARYTYPQELAGQVFSLEDQCNHYIGGVPCQVNDKIDQFYQIFCIFSSNFSNL